MRERKESVVDYPELRAQKARLGLRSEDLIKMSNTSNTSVSAFLNGAETLNLQTMIQIADALGLQLRVEFEPKKAEPEPMRLVA